MSKHAFDAYLDEVADDLGPLSWEPSDEELARMAAEAEQEWAQRHPEERTEGR